jgi:hypothetical protein
MKHILNAQIRHRSLEASMSGIGDTAYAVWKAEPETTPGMRGTNNMPLCAEGFPREKPASKTPAVTTNSHESPGRIGAGDARASEENLRQR